MFSFINQSFFIVTLEEELKYTFQKWPGYPDILNPVGKVWFLLRNGMLYLWKMPIVTYFTGHECFPSSFSMDVAGGYDPRDSGGFIKVTALRCVQPKWLPAQGFQKFLHESLWITQGRFSLFFHKYHTEYLLMFCNTNFGQIRRSCYLLNIVCNLN